MRIAVIDLGTNNFQLLIAEAEGKHLKKIFKKSIFVRIGKSGISRSTIAPDAFERALEAMKAHKQTIEQHQVRATYAIATSAIRNADNGARLVESIKKETDIDVEVIDGNQEATYIFEGVAHQIPLISTSLIMDIGGGSVEFIIAEQHNICWKHSFEIGGQRLLDKFLTQDPLPLAQKQAMLGYLEDTLSPLWQAITLFNPKNFIGSAGAFDTILQMVKHHHNQSRLENNTITTQEFDRIFQEMTTLPRQERLSVHGMIPERVDMIVPAVCLIQTVVKATGIDKLCVATASLKEGVAVVKLNLQS